MEKLLSLYKKGSIVYPKVVSINTKTDMNSVYHLLDERKDVKKMYLVRCPYCNCIASSHRYYSLVELGDNQETGCNHCDSVFIIDKNHNLEVVYEKI